MIQLCYASTAARPMTAAQLLAILQQCYGHNPLHDITGLLLYGNGTFLQALEGDDAVVSALYDKIASDGRHRDVTCLSRRTIATRSYPGWSMAFRRMPEIGWRGSDGRRRLAQDAFTVDGLAGDAAARDALLAEFATSGTPAPETDARDGEVASLRKALRRAQGGVEIARLVLEDLAEIHAAGRLGDTEGRLCRFALGQINGI